MIYYMDTKTFASTYLDNEDDQDILDAQYILVSTRIRTSNETETAINGYLLFPHMEILDAWYNKIDIWAELYTEQLDSNIVFIATIIRGVIEKGYNVIFLNSHREKKNLDYLTFIANYIYDTFGYPVYNYKDYYKGKYKLIKYDKAKVYEKCVKIMEDGEEKGYLKGLHDPLNRDYTMKKLMKRPKYMKKLLKKNGLYTKGLSKEEMIDLMFYCAYDDEG